MRTILTVATLTMLAQGAGAQRDGGALPSRRAAALAARGQQPDSARRNRAALEGNVGQQMFKIMRNRMGLTDAQMTKVREINQRYAQRRQMITQNERDIRISLREEMIAADSTHQAQVAGLLDRLLKAQRQRFDIQEQEQKDLGAVLTPLQRAQYINIEEQVRQRMNQMRMQQQGAGGPPPEVEPNGPLPGANGFAGRRGQVRPNPDGTLPPLPQRRPPGGVPPTP